LSLTAAVLVVAYGLGITGAGVYSCDPGCPRQNVSFEATLHRVVSIISCTAGILGTALWAYRFRALAAWRSLWGYSAVSSAVALALLLVLNASEESRAFTGVWQRLFVVTLDLWCAVVGIRVFRSPAAGDGA
jgi:hypothetical protein